MALTGEEIRANLTRFAAHWTLYHGSERSEAQTFLNGLLALVLDAGIVLTAGEIAHLGLQRGRVSDGYRGEYYTFGA